MQGWQPRKQRPESSRWRALLRRVYGGPRPSRAAWSSILTATRTVTPSRSRQCPRAAQADTRGLAVKPWTKPRAEGQLELLLARQMLVAWTGDAQRALALAVMALIVMRMGAAHRARRLILAASQERLGRGPCPFRSPQLTTAAAEEGWGESLRDAWSHTHLMLHREKPLAAKEALPKERNSRPLGDPCHGEIVVVIICCLAMNELLSLTVLRYYDGSKCNPIRCKAGVTYSTRV